jgi:putative isomerase
MKIQYGRKDTPYLKKILRALTAWRRAFVLTGLIMCLQFPHRLFPQPQDGVYRQEDYADVLDLCRTPASPGDTLAHFFSDLGAWHAFGLPSTTDTLHWGGFTGPLVMKTTGRWLGSSLARFTLNGPDPAAYNDLAQADSVSLTFLPGRLHQYFRLKKAEVAISLIFVSGRTALITAIVKNTCGGTLNLMPGWTGRLFNPDSLFMLSGGDLACRWDESGGFLFMKPDRGMTFKAIAGGYSLTGEKFKLKKGESVTFSLAVAHFFDEQEMLLELPNIRRALAEPAADLAQNAARWQRYLGGLMKVRPFILKGEEYDRLLVKCLETLLTDWRSAANNLAYDGLFPSSAINGFYGFRAAEAWEQAAALAGFEPELARGQVRAMLDQQDSLGMVPRAVYHFRSGDDQRCSNPPLAAWAVWTIFDRTGDTAFIREVFPKLYGYHRWWYGNRDHNGDGLCEYGAGSNDLSLAIQESGVHGNVRFRGAAMLQNNDHAWSMDREAVDLNAFLFAEKKYLSALAGICGDKELKTRLVMEARNLKVMMRDLMYDRKEGYFYDLTVDSAKKIPARGLWGCIPLWAGLAHPEQAKEMVMSLVDTLQFNAFIPFRDPPVPGHDTDWLNRQGSVSMTQACFALLGLKSFELVDEYQTLLLKLLKNARGLLYEPGPLWENYDPLTGEGEGLAYFGGTAALLLIILTSEE